MFIDMFHSSITFAKGFPEILKTQTMKKAVIHLRLFTYNIV